MRITLVNPPAEKIVEIHDKPKYPQISIGYLAGYLEGKNIACKVIDSKMEGIKDNEVVDRCVGEDLVGITSMTHEINFCAKLAEKIKKESPNTRVVIGGVHATFLPGETMETFKSFDYLVYGEGEHTLYELIKAIDNGGDFEKINGLAFRAEDKTSINQPRMLEEDLNNFPSPAWHLFPNAKEYIVMTSRGCPFGCIFCSKVYGRKVRFRSVSKVMEEIQMLVDKYQAKHMYIYDDTFTLIKDRTVEICDEIIKRGLNKKLRWETETRVSCVDMEILTKLKKAGCVLVKFGIESGNPEILKKVEKGITIEQAREAVKMAKKAKLRTEGLFILGHPNETKETMKDTINLAVKLNTSTVAFGIMTPYPKTKVYEMAKRGEGGYKILSSDWRDYNKQFGNALELKNVSRKEMEKIQFWGYMKFFFYNFKIKEIIKNIIRHHNLAFAMIKKLISKN